jgi:hypothetical protein
MEQLAGDLVFDRGSRRMPLYKFGLDERCTLDNAAEWHADDVAALQAAPQFTADLVRNRDDRQESIPMVLTFRVKAHA